MNAAIVKLNTLTDTVRSTAQHHDLFLVGRLGLALILVGRVHISCIGRKLGRTGIDPLVDRTNAELVATLTHRGFTSFGQMRQTTVSKTFALQETQLFCGQRRKITFFDFQLKVNELLDLNQEPRINLRQVKDFLDRHADTEGISNVPQAIRRWPGQLFIDSFRIH